ncbi:PaaI family thioesterase [Pimelobacter sp. 30-1]|uniref:PaaI family thioesterase n=1 Tax=Pimelobacter sp. 30-1 TaxID=2004991 RepID=UPI001C05B58B|nr:PaaI family thioesterase [Pimelobacter sp. 30-1]MBU2695688.1 thioesterase [Pimelobacter sp. 30-1]
MNWPFAADDTPASVVEEEAAVWRPLAEAARELVDLCVMSDVDEAEVRAAQADVEAAVARLRKVRRTQTLGQEHLTAGRRRPWGNPVIGLRNPIAPPLEVHSRPDGRAETDFHCGAAYEGPPGLVHGGVVALILDQVLGHSVGAAGRPGMTGTLTLVYRQGTPLGDLRVEAWIDREDGIKTWAKARMIGPDGVTAEAEGVFILPRAVRESLSRRP